MRFVFIDSTIDDNLAEYQLAKNNFIKMSYVSIAK